jgi:hypothetical protein
VPNREFKAILRDDGIPNGLSAPAPLIELPAMILRTESELVLQGVRGSRRPLAPSVRLKKRFESQNSVPNAKRDT